MATSSHVSDVSFELIPLSVRVPPHEDDMAVVVDDDNFPTVDEIIPCNDKSMLDFLKKPTEDPESVLSKLDEAVLAELRVKYEIPAYINLVLVGGAVVQVHRLGYYAFYVYSFRIGYSLALPLLVEEFCRYY